MAKLNQTGNRRCRRQPLKDRSHIDGHDPWVGLDAVVVPAFTDRAVGSTDLSYSPVLAGLRWCLGFLFALVPLSLLTRLDRATPPVGLALWTRGVFTGRHRELSAECAAE